MRTLQQIVDKLREDAQQMLSPFWAHDPEEPDWQYVAGAFLEIANEITIAMGGDLAPGDIPVRRIKMLVHKNLKMSERKVAAQCVHAALGLYKKNPQDHWSCVILEASTTQFKQAIERHPEAYVVTDAGYTEIPAGSKTVIAWYEEDDGKQGE